MEQYLQLCEHIKENGGDKGDRTGTGTRSVFGTQLRFDLQKGFPLLTTKRVPFKLVASELLWFVKGNTNIKYLLKHNNHIWDEWAFLNYICSDEYTGELDESFGRKASKDPVFAEIVKAEMDAFCERILTDDAFCKKFGDLGKVYGKQWRSWETADGRIDQLQGAITQIKRNPDSRRLLVVAWNPGEVDQMALPPCHYAFQYYVQDNKLSCMFQMRSVDTFLGLPFNIASYALLTHMIANECGLEVGELIFTGGDTHIYSNHFEQINELLTRTPKALPTLSLTPGKPVFEMTMEDITLNGYDPHPTIKAPIAV